jgi:hypothetical protein
MGRMRMGVFVGVEMCLQVPPLEPGGCESFLQFQDMGISVPDSEYRTGCLSHFDSDFARFQSRDQGRPWVLKVL